LIFHLFERLTWSDAPGVSTNNWNPLFDAPSFRDLGMHNVISTFLSCLLGSSPVSPPGPSSDPQEQKSTSTLFAEPAAPFAFADFSWVPGNYGASEKPLAFGPFTGELSGACMTDTIFILITVGFFAVAWAYTQACDHL
jgi:hypothetical protein